jgi:hypothetical protein
MARKLSPQEQEDFSEILKEAELSGHRETETLSSDLAEKSKAKLKLSPELSFWFGDDVSGLPLP